MNRIIVPFVLVFPLILWGITGLQATRGQQGRAPTPTQDVLLITAARPVPLQLQVKVEGETGSAWDLYLEKLFTFLDLNGDGTLSARELLCAPAGEQLSELTQNNEVISALPAPTFEEMAGTPTGTITRDKFKSYYQREGLGPLYFESGRRQTADLLTENLWQRLDRDKDDKLSRAELKAADLLLRSLDTNEDDLLQLSEILGREAPATEFVFEAPVRFQDALAKGALVLRQGLKATDIAPGLMRRLDRDKNGKLTRAEIGLERALFARFDVDHDDEWTVLELQQWLESRPEARLELELNKGRASTTIRFFADKETSPLALRWEESGRRLNVGERTVVEFHNGSGIETTPKLLKERYLREFQTLDTNKNGTLERAEVFKPPFAWVAILRLLDRDGDDKITRKELDTWLELQTEAVVSVVTLTMADRGASLFELLDRDRDGRLSPRELISAWEQLKPWDRDGDNVILRTELPHQYHFTLTRGQWRQATATTPAPGYGPALQRPEPRGPMWFRKMDRNMDGDISPREFLGTREAFRKLDRNGDGLIDVIEAETVNK